MALHTPVAVASHRSRAIGVAAALLLAGVALAQDQRIGTIGDSLTDEYAEETYSYARNWVQQLVTTRGVDCGPTAAQAGQAGNTWGEPRRTQYRTNWARYGADVSDAISQGQHTGLAAQASAGQIDYVIVVIGANEFSPQISAYFNIYNGLWSSAQITSYVNAALNNLTTIVNTLKSAGKPIVIANAPDFGMVPGAYTNFLYSNATRRLRVTAAVNQLNAGIRTIAQNNDLVLIDMLGLQQAIQGTQNALKTSLILGNRTINLQQKDTASHTLPYAGFVDDGGHPHTTLQGIFANAMIEALNLGYHAGMTTLSEQEILTNAGLPYGGVDTLFSQIGDIRRFITSYACAADYNADGFLDFTDFDEFVNLFEEGSQRADFNNDGFLDFTDFDAFILAFETGC
ncbi:MAG: GDSL-type esterase/lipase family protein [Planctomycetota bacterium]|nr:GDSL-type esterase/lipase family protein [Planctomycetota bacterium]